VSNSPWSGAGVLRQVRREIAAQPELRRGGVLVLDESPVKKAGTKTAGAARQWNGRIGHVDLSQVGTFLAFANGPVWTWVDGELFRPERWLGPELATERERLGIPAERTFKTKVELGWEMIRRAQAEGLPFEAVACDELYGRSGWLRVRLDESEIGWDELQAQKYRAWEHHLALTILAAWFVAETKLDWARDHPRDPSLVADFAIDRLPDLSVANVRSMLRAALPLPDLTADRAAALVVEHLVNRTRSRRSRRKRQLHAGHTLTGM
jgi:hypothetical protein